MKAAGSAGRPGDAAPQPPSARTSAVTVRNRSVGEILVSLGPARFLGPIGAGSGSGGHPTRIGVRRGFVSPRPGFHGRTCFERPRLRRGSAGGRAGPPAPLVFKPTRQRPDRRDPGRSDEHQPPQTRSSTGATPRGGRQIPASGRPVVGFSSNDRGMLIWLDDRSRPAEGFARSFVLEHSGIGNDIDAWPRFAVARSAPGCRA